MNATDDRRARALAAGLAAVFGLVAVLAAIDLAADVGEGTTMRHALIEGGTVAVGLGGFVWMAARYRSLVHESRALARRNDDLSQLNDDLAQRAGDLALRADDLAERLEASRRDAERWRGEAHDLIAGLGAAIDRQLERWGLSPAEKEIALLLLKGLSHKEVAEVRDVSEATVRQQARAIYKKSGLTGRADLAAFFLEDLLGPKAPPAA
ncbi:MAG: LuxR C-terminal-related transcriptional regulator [Deltaproteobacteria bacterium]|nr:LuxR C-terminal-related transcriptional regulator [Deltaproteobacteria bacterium]